jgi:UPF0755 protein
MLRKTVSGLLLLALVILLAATALFVREYGVPGPGGIRKVLFEIKPGQSVRAIAENLRSEKMIRSSWAFLAGYRLFHQGKKLKAGEYELSLPLTIKKVLAVLLEGKVFLHPLTVPEGLTAREVEALIREAAFPLKGSFLTACGDPGPIASRDARAKDLEGYLFPDTYHFPKDVSARTVAATMVDQFKKVFGVAEMMRAAELRLSVRNVVTLASLIEKETSIPEERPLVSAVFHNRLRMGMKLDCDPTVIYALKMDNLYRGRLLTKDLKYPSPYNTYVSPGLPPGPICSPGQGSLAAALHPAHEDYLYFVASDDGSHRFSRGYAEHLRAVKKYHWKNR